MKSLATLYAKIAAELTEGIVSGRYPLHSLLPTETELVHSHSVSRHTVREALRVLTEDGLVKRTAGLGSVVISTVPTRRTESRANGRDLLAHTQGGRFKVISWKVVNAVDDLEPLPLAVWSGGGLLQITLIRFSAGSKSPYCLSKIYIGEAHTGAVRTEFDVGKEAEFRVPIFELVARKYKIRLGRVDQNMSSTTMPQEVSSLLGVNAGSSCLRQARAFFDDGGITIQMAVNFFLSDVFVYRSSMRLDQ